MTSLFELFKVGVGPSSSHTVGPMRAALRFVQSLRAEEHLGCVASITVDLYGSLALTGTGHGTDRAVLLGLLGEAPETVEPASVEPQVEQIQQTQCLLLAGERSIPFDPALQILFHRDQMYPDPEQVTHPNGLRFTAHDANGEPLLQQVFYSVGGGFVVSAEEFGSRETLAQRQVPFPFRSAAELLRVAAMTDQSIAALMMSNEVALLKVPGISRPPASATRGGEEQQVRSGILGLWAVMEACIERGIATEGVLPGGLKVRRRAPGLHRRLQKLEDNATALDPLAPLDSVTLVAMAVNEENAAGGRVVTAPTNGAAGVIPAVAFFFLRHAAPERSQEERTEGLVRFFLTAGAIGILYKENASISGAEVGCQGEVGVACSMAAGGLVAALGGSDETVEHAAEIAMEHNLGMTCDPIGGLVQIPCIERNGMGAVKAVNAARLAMHDPGGHKISLDQVIETMYRTGLDMQSRYKETSLAGLALNIIEC